MKQKLLIAIAGAAALLVPQAILAACRASGSTSERIECRVTTGFFNNHIANSEANARTKTVQAQRNSTFLEANQSTLSTLQYTEQMRRTDRGQQLSTWSCAYTPPGAGRAASATCTAQDQVLYFCSDTTRPNNRVYHLDTNAHGRCN